MFQKKKYYIISIVFCFSFLLLAAQDPLERIPIKLRDDSIEVKHPPSAYYIGQIAISGNKKTKEPIILREIPLRTGEKHSLSHIVNQFEKARRQLMNTTLFHSVIVAARGFDEDTIHITIQVKERWYIFPVPHLEPIDRNLNQWLFEQKASLDRVNYGAKLLYNNVTGINDKLRFSVMGGYTRQLSLSYDRFYIDKALKWGAKVSLNLGKNREINYNTINDKQVFLKNENVFVRNFFNTQLEVTYRRAIKTRHSFGIGYTYERVADSVAVLNPSYFNGGRKKIAFPEIFYNMVYYDVDYIPYPTKGYAANITITKQGLNQADNLWHLSAQGLGSWSLWPRTFFSLEVFGGVKLPFNQPYFNRRFLGYGDIELQGYEYYVIDGVAGGFTKATLSRQILNFRIRMPKIRKEQTVEYIPFKVFAKVYGNTGYVHNPQPGDNYLSNKMLYSGGIGLDILTFYDMTLKLEWSFNQLGQNGLFLHRKSIF